MSKLISILTAATFAVASVSAFAASHAGGAMKDGDKKAGNKTVKKDGKMVAGSKKKADKKADKK